MPSENLDHPGNLQLKWGFPVIPLGWRLVENHDIICEGDFYTRKYGGTNWSEVACNKIRFYRRERLSNHLVFIRQVRRPFFVESDDSGSAKIPSGWREVGPDEDVEEHDMWCDSQPWGIGFWKSSSGEFKVRHGRIFIRMIHMDVHPPVSDEEEI